LPEAILRQAIADGIITAAWLPNTELLEVSMATENIEEAKAIVNSFLRNYVGTYGIEATTRVNRDVMILENQRHEVLMKIADIRARIQAKGSDRDTSQPIELRINEELYEKIVRRLQEMEMQQQRPPRVEIAALAEAKGVLDNRMQWPLIILGAVIVVSGILLLLALALHQARRTVGMTNPIVATPTGNS
jgi:hypothetical protein